MWKMHEIRELIKLFEESSLEEMEVELEGAENKISLKKRKGISLSDEHENVEFFKPASAPIAVKEAPALSQNKISKNVNQYSSLEKNNTKEVNKNIVGADDPIVYKIVAPMVGTFYRAPAEDSAPFVKVGDKVESSTIVCILEAMKLFNEIESEVNGEIVEVLVQDGQLVEYDQPLFLVRTE